ncbi:chemotaxis protein CheA [Sphingomonas sp.]|uniref:chemotaxis protein CheA n=1 Tax=Sphingomonas sp. TaxID=28214 RepID=UPI0035BBFB19
MDDLIQEFIAETRETLEALSGEIVAWEAEPNDRARLDAIFRFVHTVKGSCGFLELPRLARLSHAAEDVLAAVRDGKRAPDTALVSAVLAIVDRIGELVEAIDAGVALDDAQEDLLVVALEEDARPAAQAAQPVAHRSASRTVRLGVDLLDRMMNGMSEMVLARNELARRLRDEAVVEPRVEAALERLSLTVAEMRDTVTRTRMQKIDALFSALPRIVRDTAAGLGKAVALHIDGADVELDREMIEMIRDPLLHIVRNAIDHGIEAPSDRSKAGKRETGRLDICARQSGNQVLVEIADDGQGIDTARLVAKAIRSGLIDERDAAQMTPQARLDLIFSPGLSSRDTVTAVSGRGVGMDVVRANIEQIGGRIALTNRPGQGLAISIQMPLTLSILSTIVLGVGDQRFAVARQAIEEVVTIRGDTVRIDRVGDSAVANVRGQRMPLVSLGGLLGLGEGHPRLLAIVAVRDGRFALAIDAVLDTEELVVRPAAPAVMAGGLYAGQTLPDSGLPMLLLDATGIAAAAGLRFVPAAAVETVAVEVAPAIRALLFDDLDGIRRAIPLAVVDRVETVAIEAIRDSAGRRRLVTGAAIVPLHACGPFGARANVAVLRLTDGAVDIGYAIAEAIEIVALPAEIAPARGGGFVAGVAMIDGAPVEVIDAHALFAGEDVTLADPPLCLLHGDDGGWMDVFLKPALEASGYRCVASLAAGETAAVALAMEDDALAAPSAFGPAPVIRLRRDRLAAGGAASVYRYDRAALIAAIADRIGAAA